MAQSIIALSHRQNQCWFICNLDPLTYIPINLQLEKCDHLFGITTTQFSVWLALFPDSMSRAMQIGSNWTFTYALILWNHFVLFIIKFISNYVAFYIKTPAINSTNPDISNTTAVLFLWNELIRTEFEYFPEKACLEKNLHFQLLINTLKPRPNGCHFADDSYLCWTVKVFFKCIFLKENWCFFIQISLKVVLMFQCMICLHWLR